MIEIIVKGYLKSRLSIPVLLEMPEEKVNRFILIEKTGGGENDCIQSSTLAIQSYAESLAEAAKLNETVKKVMKEIILLNDICKCKLNSDYNWTDTSTKQYRYQAVYNITHY